MVYSAGTAYLTVVPSFLNIERAFRKEAENLGAEVDKAISKSVTSGMANARGGARREGERAGEEYAGAFASTVRRRLEAALKAMPKIEIDANSTPAERAIHEIRADLETLRGATIGVDLTEEEFFQEVARVQAAAEKLDHEKINIEIRTNARAVAAELEALGQVGDSSNTASAQARQARERGAEAGSQYGGAFEEAARRRLGAASNAIGKVTMNIDTTGADAELLEIRRQIDALSHTDINIDIPAHRWAAELAELELALKAVSDNAVEINVKTNARAALAEIQALRNATGQPDPSRQGTRDGSEYAGAYATAVRNTLKAALEALPEIHLNANSSNVDRTIDNIRTRLVALSNARIGIDINAATASAEITRLQVRLRELGSADPRIDVHTNLLATAAELATLQEMVRHLDGQNINLDVNTGNAASEVSSLADSAGVSLSRMGALVAAGVSIGTAIVPAAAAAAAAISAIATAASAAALGIGVFALGIFGPIKAIAALQAAHNASAKAAVGDASAQARVSSALDSVTNAQQSLAKAERERLQAVQDLSKAQEDARRQLEDMSIAVRENALAQRQARLDEAAAKDALDQLLANPRATDAEREQARITYQEKLLQIQDLGIKGKRLAADQADAVKKGVNGSDQVVAAQRRIQDANDALASAQRQVAASQRALALAYEKTGTAGGTAMSNLARAMAALTPAGRRFALFIFGLKGDFQKLQGAAENGLLPGLQHAIETLLPFLPTVTRLVGNIAKTIGDGFAYVATQLKDPVFRRFFDYIASIAVPALKGMFEFATNVAKGIAGILLGLSGFNGSIGEGLLKWSEGFAKWGSTLDKNKGWQHFISYVRDAAPKVVDFFKNLWDFTVKFVEAAAPIGKFVVQAFSDLFKWLNKLDTGTWTIIIGAIGAIGIALLAVAGVTSLIGTGIAGGIAAAVALIGAGLVILYQKVKPFRTAVEATFKAITAAAVGLWQNSLKPAFDATVTGVHIVAGVFETLYDRIFVHIFSAIDGIVSAFWSTLQTVFTALSPVFNFFGQVAKAAFDIFIGATKIAGAIFIWLWDHALKPVFTFIGIAFDVFKAVFQVAFGLFQIAVKVAAAIFHSFYDTAIKPVIDLLRPLFSWLGSVIHDDVVPPFKKGLELMGSAWDAFVNASKAAIKFVVDIVLNDGLLAAYNKIAKTFNVTPDNVHIDLPKSFGGSGDPGAFGGGAHGHDSAPGFATGGALDGPGTGTSDSLLIRASKGEHVWTAKEVEAAGGHDVVFALRRAVLGGWLPGFADGGIIGAAGDFFGSAVGGITDFFADPTAALQALAKKLFAEMPGKDSPAAKIILGMPAKVLNMLVDKVQSIFSAGNLGSAVFGAAGGGRSGPGFPPWPASPMTSRGDSGVWRSIVALIRSTGPISGTFGNAYRPGDPLWHGSGRAVDWMGFNQDALATWLTTRNPLELIHRTSLRDYAYTRGVNKGSFNNQLMEEHRNHVHIAMDQGGLLPTGLSTIFNGTGVPEPVLTGRQWQDINALARGGGGKPGSSYHFEFRDTTLDQGKLRAIQDREAAYSREGRAR